MVPFFANFERQLREAEIPSRKWLSTLEGILEGKTLSVCHGTLELGQRETYKAARDGLLQCLGPDVSVHFDRMGDLVWKRDESV